MVQQQIADAPAPLHVHRDGLPDWCEPILRRALAKAPADRFQTAEEFRDTLQRAAGSPTPEAAHAFFGSIVDIETTETPGILERFGVTRIWGAIPSKIGTAAARAMAVTVVPPRRRLTVTAMLIMVPMGAIAALGLAGQWRQAAATSSAARPTSGATPPAVVTLEASAPGAPNWPAASTEPAASATDVPPATPVLVGRASVPAAVPYAFDAMALVNGAGRARERASQVFLIDGLINVKANDDNSLLYTLPLDSVLSMTYSDGRDPLWTGPTGPTAVVRGPMGLGIFRGPRHWVALHTEDPGARFVVLRFANRDRTRSAIAALEQRTGHATAVLTEDVR